MKGSTVRRLLVLLASLALLAAACSGNGEETADDDQFEAEESPPAAPGTDEEATPEEDIERGTVVVGSTNFTEQELIAEMYALVLEDAGYTVERRYQLGSREVVFPALEGGELDVTPEYVGTLLEFISGGAGEATSDSEETLGLLQEQLPEGLVVLEPSEAEDKNVLALTRDTADELDASAVSDLQDHANDLVLGGPPECPQRPLCLPGYEETYGLEFAEYRPLDTGGPLTTEALNEGEVDVGLVFSTQGAIAANDWVVLEDDEGLQPAENITPAIREEVLNDEIEQLLNGVSAALTTEQVIQLNERIDIDEEAPADVAQSFLEQEGLLDGSG